jgi:CubicO group peptidase (beta-lactamase class C family)
MSNLHDILQAYVSNGSVPGAVGLTARSGRVEVQVVGSADADGTSPITRDSIFRIASITKPITAAAVMMLVEDGRIALDDPVRQWLPELASPTVVRTPASPVDDVVPAARPITVADLLTFRAGYGFPSDFSLPAVGLLFSELKQGPPQPQLVAAPDYWMAALSRIPLLRQPGEAWLYNTCSDILGVLIARVSGRSLPEFLAERLFEPLGMADTGFAVPAGKLDRFTSYYRTDPAGGLELVDAPDGQWSSLPVFPSGAGGLATATATPHEAL